MTSMVSRSRGSSLNESDPAIIELQRQLQVLQGQSLSSGKGNVLEDLYKRLEVGSLIRQSLLDDTGHNRAKDAFRHFDGFGILLLALESSMSNYNAGAEQDENITALLLNFLQVIFGIMTAAFQEHKGNQKYFRESVEGGGWSALENTFNRVLFSKSDIKHLEASEIWEQLFGSLLTCILNDDSVSGFFKGLQRALNNNDRNETLSKNNAPNEYRPSNVSSQVEILEEHQVNASATIYDFARKELGTLAVVQNPDAALIMFNLWRLCPLGSNMKSRISDRSHILSGVPCVITYLATVSTGNLAALHGTGLLSRILAYLLSSPALDLAFTENRNLALALLGLGVNGLHDAELLYRQARTSKLASELLLLSLSSSRTPSYIHFDLSLHGFASIELPGIGRTFPPASPSAGYTISFWFQIVHFDPKSHTTIFGAFDASQTCFVLIYLEKDSHNLILQTSVTSSRPSVRFKSTSFHEGHWYHAVIVHRRPKTTSSSRASLFVNGEFVEQVKSQYPAVPPSTSVRDNSARKSNAIQAFIGTPQDLATHHGKGLVFAQWRLASANLFAEALSDDLIAVYYQLGPRYVGNYQDCLGSFQTYQASAALNLRNESLHPGKEENSEIVLAIKSKAGVLLPESNVLLNISATVILDDNDQNNIDETALLRLISKASGKTLRGVTRGGRNALAVNGAIPSINDALLHPSGFAVLTGDPTVIVPQSLDDAAWRIGGCAAVGLTLVEAAHGPNDFLRALDVLFESIRENWRNSEAMERQHGFSVLSTLIESKLGQATFSGPTENQQSKDLSEGQLSASLAHRVLIKILKFIGYSEDKREDSVINNPLAYRILLVDMGFWRKADLSVQQLYYDQFVVFGVHSKYHLFNMKRLLRMRVIKKWLDALKGEIFTTRAFEYFLLAFKSLLTRNLSSDSMRSLALFITYAIHKPTKHSLSPARGMSIKLNTNLTSRRQTLSDSSSHTPAHKNSGPQLSSLQMALRILELFTDLLCTREDSANIKKFARTVTNKWLLHLLADDEAAVAVLAAKILARLLVVSGPQYVEKFVDRSGGMIILQYRLRRWWNILTLWPICFAILFGLDVACIDFDQSFDLFSLLGTFAHGGKAIVTYPAILPVITAMLGEGLKSVTRDQSDPDSPLIKKNEGKTPIVVESPATPTHVKQNLMISTTPSIGHSSMKSSGDLETSASTFRTVTRFLAEIHMKSESFRDFTATSAYVQELFTVLFPAVVSANSVSAAVELDARDSTLTFQGEDVIMRPLSPNVMQTAPIVRTAAAKGTQLQNPIRIQPPTRMSSYVLVTSEPSAAGPLISKLQPVLSPHRFKVPLSLSGSIVEELLELIIAVYSDQVFTRKDFPGLGLFMRVPPGFQEHQAYFETFILRSTITHLGNSIKLDQKLLWEPRVITNLARFATHLSEAVYEGWFINGAETALEFLAQILEYFQLPTVSSIKAVRLCSQIISNIRNVLFRVVLLRFSELDEAASETENTKFLKRLAYWHNVLLPQADPEDLFLRLLCYLIYNKLISRSGSVRFAAADLWRMLFVQKSDEILALLHPANATDGLVEGFKTIIELDNETFLSWIESQREKLDSFMFTTLSKAWDMFVAEENRRTEETAKARINKRREKLKLWVLNDVARDEVLRRHETGTDHWRSNIYAAERLKRQRAVQDHQDAHLFNISTWAKMTREVHRPCGVFDDMSTSKWQLDQTEGRNRMRMRFLADKEAHLHDYQPKRRQSQGPSRQRRSTGTRVKQFVSDMPPISTQTQQNQDLSAVPNGSFSSPTVKSASLSEDVNVTEADDEYEMVEDPRDDPEEYEDKNRKVMRSLERGDEVEYVHNVSRVVGLEAIEGLLIMGKANLYLLDNLFQRSDGEVVNVWQAPKEERDPYLQMISGRESGDRAAPHMKTIYEARSWKWDEVLSISKRRFLFRDVAIEVFFIDGRSYLLTIGAPTLRDELYQKLLNKASVATGQAPSANSEDSWRIDSLRSPSVEVQTLGSRFTNVFAQSSANPATRRWLKGEISNFHYLMIVNTMAGRTFNDLTQYPIFPWVISDYESEELDLTNPRSFRDLTKPMGCQSPAREANFRDRYNSFAEMGDENSPPFHYGTHYSSAMIVTSYLIRLQPFVHSYLLLQGGSFDHPDRLFYSIEKAWSSASRESMTDVRELIPEFYYLPEFLLNQNGYDFGTRQGAGGTVDKVELPPWAKGDPKIFITKQREALESDYVSRNLHHWIDLIFGHKQRGEAALEATNVFHHLSYHGAKDLDTINDPVERLATIGIIHNFGQTPHQVFQRAHPPQDDLKHRTKKLDTTAETLTRLPFPVLETPDHVSFLQYSSKHERLLCSGPFRLNIGPAYDKYLEWGFIDGSVRFFAMENKKPLGLFEHVHQGQLSYVLLADSKTLVTAGSDCTVSVWTIIATPDSVDLQPKTCLFAHRSAVTMLAVSRSFRTLLSASSDGQVLLWDLNGLDLVRKLAVGKPVDCARINDVTGTILLCRGSEITLLTLNGDPILTQDIQVDGDDTISSCAFYEGSGNEHLARNLIFTGHKKGVVNIWNILISDGQFVLEHVKRLHHLDHAGYNVGATVTAILPMAQKVYTGDDDGRVYEWACIQRQ